MELLLDVLVNGFASSIVEDCGVPVGRYERIFRLLPVGLEIWSGVAPPPWSRWQWLIMLDGLIGVVLVDVGWCRKVGPRLQILSLEILGRNILIIIDLSELPEGPRVHHLRPRNRAVTLQILTVLLLIVAALWSLEPRRLQPRIFKGSIDLPVE